MCSEKRTRNIASIFVTLKPWCPTQPVYCTSFNRALITYIHWEKTIYAKLLSFKHRESIFRKGHFQSNSLACTRHVAGYNSTIILKQCAVYKTEEVFVLCIQVYYSHLYFKRSRPTPIREYKFQKLICQLHFSTTAS